MNRDNIIKLAQLMMTDQHTRQYADPLYCFNETDIVHFVHVVQAVEREECAAECERMMMFPGGRQESFVHHGVHEAAKAIRERSNAKLSGAEGVRS